jgi:hypothetical protein
MSTPTEEITLDIAALDAAAGQTPDKQPPAADIQVETAQEPTPEPKKTEIPTEEGVEKLRKQLETERAARLAAESHAREAAQGEVEARQTAQTSQLDLVKSAIDRVTQANDTLEAQYADAMAAQDFKAAAKAQRQMSDNSAKLAQLEAGKNALEKAPKPTPRAPVDPVESFASTLSPASASWVRAHPEYVRDPNKNRKMLAAHNIALADGATADTPEYFKSIEETLKIAPIIAKPREEPTEHDDPMADAARPANGGRQAAPAAPVTRSPTNGSGQRPGTIRLTPDQREMARNMFPDSKDPDKEYALNLMELRKEGRLS